MCSYEKAGQPGNRDLSFNNRDLGNRDEIFPYEHFSKGTGTKRGGQKSITGHVLNEQGTGYEHIFSWYEYSVSIELKIEQSSERASKN